jgi:hypothetical protein
MRAEFYERTVVQRYEGYRIIAAFAICIVGSPLLILFIVSFITGMTRFFQRRINYTHYIVPSNFRGEKRRARVAARARARGRRKVAIGGHCCRGEDRCCAPIAYVVLYFSHQ